MDQAATGTVDGASLGTSLEELNTISASDVIAALTNEAAPERIANAAEALSDALEAAVEASPDRWADAADQFLNVPPVYVRHLLSGLHAAIRAGAVLPWLPVLRHMRLVRDGIDGCV